MSWSVQKGCEDCSSVSGSDSDEKGRTKSAKLYIQRFSHCRNTPSDDVKSRTDSSNCTNHRNLNFHFINTMSWWIEFWCFSPTRQKTQCTILVSWLDGWMDVQVDLPSLLFFSNSLINPISCSLLRRSILWFFRFTLVVSSLCSSIR